MPDLARDALVGVVGHVEWVTHALGRVPAPGAIADLSEPFDEPAGGGAVAAAAVARVGGQALLFTAIGADLAAARGARVLADRGVEIVAATRPAPQTRVLSITDPGGERTIMVVGTRLQPTAADDLPWSRMPGLRAAYYAGEDPGALVHARAARCLVLTGQRLSDAIAAGVRPDVVVASGADPDEDPWGLPGALAPEAIVLTDGPRGGTVHRPGTSVLRFAAVPPPGPIVDSYGCGDSFAGVLALALARGHALAEAVPLAATAAAACVTWRGGLGPGP